MCDADEFPQSPEQVTLTHQWMNTKRRGRDDEEISRDSKKALAARKRSKKVFVREPVKSPVSEIEIVEMKDVPPPEVMEAIVEDVVESVASSTTNDSAFDKKLISPEAKRLNRRIINTPPSRQKRNNNPESRMVRDLNAQIILQQKVIADLRNKLAIIRDISNDSKVLNKKEMKMKTKLTEVTTEEDGMPTTTNLRLPSTSKGKNVINLHVY